MKTFSADDLQRLNSDEVFQRTVATDKTLADYFALPEKTPEDTELEFFAYMGGRFRFGEGFFQVISAGVISLLSFFDSPFICTGKPITTHDVDVAAFLLCNGKNVLELGNKNEINKMADGFCSAVGVDVEDAYKLILKALRVSFLGLSYLRGLDSKKNDIGEQVNPFDVEWLTRQTALAHTVCGYTPEEARWSVSVCELCYIACQRARENGVVVSRPKRADLVMERLHELMEERLRELNMERNNG